MSSGVLALALLLACAAEEKDERTPAQRADQEARALWKEPVEPVTPVAPTQVAPPSTQAVAAPSDGATPKPTPAAAVTYTYEGINTLYKSFLADAVLQSNLLRELAGAVQGAPDLYIRYDQIAVRGHIQLRVAPGALTLPVRVQGDRVMVQDLAPIMVALDNYRVGLGARYDLRLLNFRVAVQLRGGGRTCLFGPAGDPPPDGSVVSPCVVVGGQRECGEPGKDGVRFAPEVHRAVLACLGA